MSSFCPRSSPSDSCASDPPDDDDQDNSEIEFKSPGHTDSEPGYTFQDRMDHFAATLRRPGIPFPYVDYNPDFISHSDESSHGVVEPDPDATVASDSESHVHESEALPSSPTSTTTSEAQQDSVPMPLGDAAQEDYYDFNVGFAEEGDANLSDQSTSVGPDECDHFESEPSSENDSTADMNMSAEAATQQSLKRSHSDMAMIHYSHDSD